MSKRNNCTLISNLLLPGCKGIFPQVYRLSEHVKTHTQEKVIGCPTCGTLFCSRAKFLDHCNRQIPENSKYYIFFTLETKKLFIFNIQHLKLLDLKVMLQFQFIWKILYNYKIHLIYIYILNLFVTVLILLEIIKYCIPLLLHM